MIKKISYIAAGILIGLFASRMFVAQKNATENMEKAAPEPKTKAMSAALIETLIIPDAQDQDNSSSSLYHVIKVIDGDTIAIDMNGKTETLRLIGINTPETVDPRKPVECFGKEASSKAKELLAGKNISIKTDPTQDERDKYARLLAYIYREDGLFFNKYMVEEGYAYEYTYNTPYKYQTEFKAAQSQAEKNKKGLWANGVCETEKPPTQTEPAPPVAGYSCAANLYNCTDFKTQKQAQSVFDMCGGATNDIHKLDSDKDGVVCESLP